MSRQQRITDLLSQQLQPSFLDIINESNRHHVPAGSETHFKITATSSQFQGLSLLDRHRLINKLLADELNQGLHALSLHLYTKEEWDAKGFQAPQSPACRDGYRHG